MIKPQFKLIIIIIVLYKKNHVMTIKLIDATTCIYVHMLMVMTRQQELLSLVELHSQTMSIHSLSHFLDFHMETKLALQNLNLERAVAITDFFLGLDAGEDF